MVRRVLTVGMLFLILGGFLVLADRLLADSGTILAKVGSEVITQADLDEYLAKNASMRKGRPYLPEEKKAMLDNMIKGILISVEAEKEKMDQTPEFKAKVKVQRMELLSQEYFTKKVQPQVTVTDEEVEEVFREHPGLMQKESVQFKEILVNTEKEANAIYEDLKKGGDFASIAVGKSKAETRVSGGNRRPVARGQQLPKELEEVVFNLKPGELSKPVKTEKGFYIVSLIEKKVKSDKEMEDLKQKLSVKVRQIQSSEKAQAVIEKQATELREKAKPEVYYDRIQN
jgi:peptidyl-prolyl cis-trans isomerase C